MRLQRLLLMLGLGLGLGGCADPLEGTWRGVDELFCGTSTDHVEFTVDGDMNGTGEYCECDFTFVAEPRDDERYRFDIDFDGPCFVPDGKYDCDWQREGERLDCGDLGDYKIVGE